MVQWFSDEALHSTNWRFRLKKCTLSVVLSVMTHGIRDYRVIYWPWQGVAMAWWLEFTIQSSHVFKSQINQWWWEEGHPTLICFWAPTAINNVELTPWPRTAINNVEITPWPRTAINNVEITPWPRTAINNVEEYKLHDPVQRLIMRSINSITPYSD